MLHGGSSLPERLAEGSRAQELEAMLHAQANWLGSPETYSPGQADERGFALKIRDGQSLGGHLLRTESSANKRAASLCLLPQSAPALPGASDDSSLHNFQQSQLNNLQVRWRKVHVHGADRTSL